MSRAISYLKNALVEFESLAHRQPLVAASAGLVAIARLSTRIGKTLHNALLKP
ncbi:MAG: hypothetical protein ABMA15_21165 [Vicinamibacterales bacterium]